MIPDAAVEAAWGDEGANPRRAISRSEIWAILEAAAPQLMRTAWDEGWEAHGDWGGPTPNPYRTAR